MADPGNIYSLIMGDSPDAETQAAALADSIRRNRTRAAVGALAGDTPLGAMMAQYGKQATQDQGLLEKGAVARAHYGQEQMKAKGDLAQALALMKQRQAEMLEAGRNDRFRLGLEAKLKGQELKSADDTKNYDKAQADIIKFSGDIDAATKARSATGVAAQNLYRSAAAQALMKNGPVTKQMLEDIAITMARISGGGGNIGEKMAEELKAKGIKADVAGMQSYLSSHPVDVNMKEWLKTLTEKLQMEDLAADDFIRQSAIKQASRMGRAAKHAPEDLARVLKQHGLDNYLNDDMLTTVAPAHLASKVGKAEIAKFKAKLAPGERLAFDKAGNPFGLGKDEKLQEGEWEAP